MQEPWETEAEEPEYPDKAIFNGKEYVVKVHIALEDSDNETWGMVRDTGGNLLWKPGDGPLVGKWSRSPSDGLIHVFLTTPTQALLDTAIRTFHEYAEKRKAEPRGTKSGRARTPRAPKAEPIPNEDLIKISSLRKLLGVK